MKADNVITEMINTETQDSRDLLTYIEKSGGYRCANNDDAHDLLNDACTSFEEIALQETWIFSDGSYITRSESSDLYFTGDDVDDFRLTAETCFNADGSIIT